MHDQGEHHEIVYTPFLPDWSLVSPDLALLVAEKVLSNPQSVFPG